MPSMLKMSPILEVPHGECLIISGAAGSYEAIILHYNSTVKSPGYIFLCRKRVLCIKKIDGALRGPTALRLVPAKAGQLGDFGRDVRSSA